MMKNIGRFPPVVDRDEQDGKRYEKLRSALQIEEKELQHKDIFLFALSYGFSTNVKIDIKKKVTGGFFRSETFSSEDLALIKAVAISSTGENVLNNPSLILDIAEKYAHGGIIELEKIIDDMQFGSFSKYLEGMVMKNFSEEK